MPLYFTIALSRARLASIFGRPEVELTRGFRSYGRVFAGDVYAMTRLLPTVA